MLPLDYRKIEICLVITLTIQKPRKLKGFIEYPEISICTLQPINPKKTLGLYNQIMLLTSTNYRSFIFLNVVFCNMTDVEL